MSRHVTAVEQHVFHFDLSHLRDIPQFHLRAGTRVWELVAHTDESRARYAKDNPALALIPDDRRASITHYVDSAELPADRALMLRVTYPRAEAPTKLPGLALLAVHIPTATRKAHRAGEPDLYIPTLDRYGVQHTGDDAVDVSLASDSILTPLNTTTALVFQLPQLATVNAGMAQVVLGHINNRSNANNVTQCTASITAQQGAWSSVVTSTDASGGALVWGKSFSQPGANVETNRLSDLTVAALGGPMAQPLATSQNDPRLQNASWSVRQGIGSVGHDSAGSLPALKRRRRPRAEVAGFLDASSDFALTNLTPGHGFDIEDGSFVFDNSTNTVTLNVDNNYVRSLYTYVQFYQENGQPASDLTPLALVTSTNVVLGIPVTTDPTTLTFTWPEGATSATLYAGGLGPTGWINDVCYLGAIFTAVFNFAIPMLFLYAGADDSDSESMSAVEKDTGIQATLIEIAKAVIPPLVSSSPGYDNVRTMLSAFVDGIAGMLVHAGLEELQTWLTEQLGEAGLEDAVPGVDIFFQLFNRAVDLVEIGETTVEVLCSPAAYQVSIVRSMPLTVTVNPDPTHGSPGNLAVWPLNSDHYDCVILYRGGTPRNTYGPLLGATTSTPVVVNYDSIPEGGFLQVTFNVYAKDDTLLGKWTSAWVAAQRPAPDETLALTGSIQEVLAPLTSTTLYSYREKLVYDQATSQHAWQPNSFAIPWSSTVAVNLNTVISDLNAGVPDQWVLDAFAANAVPLSEPSVQVVTAGKEWTLTSGGAGGTVYPMNYSTDNGGEIVIYSNNIPLETLVDPTDPVGNLGATVGITMNNNAYMLGYCWMASGQDVPPAGAPGAKPVTSQVYTFQNINVLANPESALKFSGVGYSDPPFIVYDQFGPVPLFSAPASVAADLNSATIDSALRLLFQQFNYALPGSGTSVAADPSGVAWTISIDTIPTYALQLLYGQVNVYLYPVQIISQNNFYLDPVSTTTGYQYNLRQITLDNSTPFNVAQTQSWGLFTVPQLSDVVVHPQGYVIGAHAIQNCLEIVTIPAAAVDDASALPAVLVGGVGTRAGLYGSPTALAVTADGRILVLEGGNQRVQAIDVNGNPIPCFTAASLGSMPSSLANDLDNSLVSAAVRAAFTQAGTTLSTIWRVQDSQAIYQLALTNGTLGVATSGASPSTQWTLVDSSASAQTFNLALNGTNLAVSQNGTALFTIALTDASIATALNAGYMAAGLSSAFVSNNVTLVSPIQITGNGLTLTTSVVAELTQGTVPVELAPALAPTGITLNTPATVTASVIVRVIQSGVEWQLVDNTAGTTYSLIVDSTTGDIDVTLLSPVMALKAVPAGQTATYLSIASESKGYIYVLSYVGNGSSIQEFSLDIYSPDGSLDGTTVPTPLATTVGVNAGDIVVDGWRNLYTLNFESFAGPGTRTEPSVSLWTPSV